VKTTSSASQQRAHTSARRDVNCWPADLGTPLSSTAETVVEVTYQAQLARGVIVQPLIQRIFNPGLSLPDSTVAGARLQLAF
jgi:carbohydrate-selective porin OprB